MEYDFNKLKLSVPITQPASTYLTRIFVDNKPLYIQTPKCETRNGFIKSGKKIYCDLMFSSDDSIFIDWVTNLEARCQKLICNKSESWFQTKYSSDEIETAFSSPLKIYKSGKYYLMRVNIKPTMKIYNDLNVEVSFDNINENVHMINVVEFYGIKFTARNFQIEVELKQSMIVSNDDFVGNCFINRCAPKEDMQLKDTPMLTQQPLYLPREPDEPPTLYLPREPDEPPQLSNVTIVEPLVEALVEPLVETRVEPYVEPPVEPYVDALVDPPVELIVEEVIEPIVSPFQELELSEFDFDTERLEESTMLHLKRPIDQYYKEYNELITRANKLKQTLSVIYSDAKKLKEIHSLNVDNIEQYIYSDLDISDSENDDDDDTIV